MQGFFVKVIARFSDKELVVENEKKLKKILKISHL